MLDIETAKSFVSIFLIGTGSGFKFLPIGSISNSAFLKGEKLNCIKGVNGGYKM